MSTGPGGAGDAADGPYATLVPQVRAAVDAHLGSGMNVLVVSKGDDALIAFEHCHGWHFPRLADGSYPGYPPHDSTAAIALLEAQRHQGADYLMIPEPAAWWLDYYPGLADYLLRSRPVVLDQEGVGAVYALSERAEAAHVIRLEDGRRRHLGEVIGAFHARFGRAPVVLDWGTRVAMPWPAGEATVFSPSLTGTTLPYLSDSFDIVVIASSALVAEGRRVCAHALVHLGSEIEAGRTEWQSAPTTAPTISIVVVPWEDQSSVFPVLASLEEAARQDASIEVVLCTGDQRDGAEREAIERLRRRVPVIDAGRSPDPANAGRLAATGDIVVFVDSGVILLPGTWSAIRSMLNAAPDIGVVCGMVLDTDGRVDSAGGHFLGDRALPIGHGGNDVEAESVSHPVDVDFAPAALVAVRRDVLIDLGGFSTEVVGGGSTATEDLCRRARHRGWRVTYDPRIIVIRTTAAASGAEPSPRVGTVWLPAGRRRVLVADIDLPREQADAHSRRMLDLLELLRDLEAEVSFLVAGRDGPPADSTPLRRRGVRVHRADPYGTPDWLAEARFDAAIFGSWEAAAFLAATVRADSPGTRIIVAASDIRPGTGRNRPFPFTDRWGTEDVADEVDTWRFADAVLVGSRRQAQIVESVTGNRRLAQVVPWLAPPPIVGRPFSERRGILLLGGWSRWSHRSAPARWLELTSVVDEALLHDHPTYLVGGRAEVSSAPLDPESTQMHVLGWVPSLAPYLAQLRAAVLPWEAETEAEQRLVQLQAAGMPTVVCGSDLDDESLDGVAVAREPKAVATHLAEILTDPGRWERLSQAGLARAADQRRELVTADLAELLDTVVGRPVATTLPVPGSHETYWRRLRRQTRLEAMPAISLLAEETLPAGAVVVVVSDDDDDGWAEIDGLTIRHLTPFEGDDVAAPVPIEQLESLRRGGAQFLVIPGPSRWWLSVCPELDRYLSTTCAVVSDDELCLLVRLGEG